MKAHNLLLTIFMHCSKNDTTMKKTLQNITKSKETSLWRNFRFSIKNKIFSWPLKVFISINLHSFELEITGLSAILLFIFHFLSGGGCFAWFPDISLWPWGHAHSLQEWKTALAFCLSLSPAAFLLCQQSSESFSHSVWAPYKQTIDSATKKDRGKERKRREK